MTIKKKYKVFALVLSTVAVTGTISVIVIGYLIRPTRAKITIETIPESRVLIDGLDAGQTPFEGEYERDEVTIKLIPMNSDTPLLPYETRVKLTPGVKTIVRRVLGEGREDSEGETISFEKLDGQDASIAIISIPDAVDVLIDDFNRNSTPLRVNNTTPGEHKITLSSPGYKTREFIVVAEPGFVLTAIVDLAQETEVLDEEPSQSPSAFVPENVVILDTPTGYLRVRAEPGSESLEVERVNSGEVYSVLDVDPETGWYQIVLEDGFDGWISPVYATQSSQIE